jgi:hypothetical protein
MLCRFFLSVALYGLGQCWQLQHNSNDLICFYHHVAHAFWFDMDITYAAKRPIPLKEVLAPCHSASHSSAPHPDDSHRTNLNTLF